MKTHHVKIWIEWFDAVRLGSKSFDLRRDDRNYTIGDTIVLEEYRHRIGEYTGRKLTRSIVYIERGKEVEAFGLKPGFVVLGLGPPIMDET